MDIASITAEEFSSLRTQWNDLLARSACTSVFLRWEWMHTWWEVFQENKRLAILTVRRDGRLAGIAPFYSERQGALSMRTLKLCSEELSPDYLDIIAEPGSEEDVTRALAHYLQHEKSWDVLALDNLSADSRLVNDASLFKGYHRTSHVSQHCPYIELKGSFADYYRGRLALHPLGLEKKWRNLLEKKNVTHRLARDETSVSQGLRDLFLLHERRAQGKKIQSNFISPGVKRFHEAVSRLFLAEGILNLQLLYDGEKPVSALYAFDYKNKTYAYQTGFDPAWSTSSVGTVLFYLGVQRAFNGGMREYDFLKGTESYKNLWSTTLREEISLTLYNKTPRGALSALMQAGHSFLKVVLRK